MQKITPCLWFNLNAEEAVNHYLSIFKNGKILDVSRYGDSVPELNGQVLTMRFEIEDQTFIALNAGPQFPFTEAISLFVDCETQEEVDHYWDRLVEGGTPGRCAWLKDKFGVSWQIVPRSLVDMLQDDDVERSARVMKAMMEMSKIDVSKLEAAYHG
ncbi:VOC family protein [Undibacterium cyanobacteriorum]|uniref:VOC family protein n=1 Tax=Undibacterium cyanobacteriorum TaxID=3073561 RepID=A0ABY9RLQ8_9BURK|nr:VOC family protein [Undibacterium sp. 20NA77.5]WMW82147.1 VOC family protein [Undibacterium sp. 20NA77.5]